MRSNTSEPTQELWGVLQAAWESGRFASLEELQDQLVPELPPGAVALQARKDNWLPARKVRQNVSDYAVSLFTKLQKDALGPVMARVAQAVGSNLDMVERAAKLVDISALQPLEQQHRRGGDVHPLQLIAMVDSIKKVADGLHKTFNVLDAALGISEGHRLRTKLVANAPPEESQGQGIQYDLMG